ncbi:MAG: type II toxin-antitoxin system HicB family antitoxin [Desulfobacula sp.]|nr:type II toxin-antitoxin system HicB family antitoxin [Desulfobacula sp.]
MMNKYEMIIHWSEEDQLFIAEVPELPGCMADGHSYQEAVSNAETIINEWLETAKDLGRTIPKPKGKLMYA